MKIAITGASSTGKTVLMSDIVSALCSYDDQFSAEYIDVRAIADRMNVKDAVKHSQSNLLDFQTEIYSEKYRHEFGKTKYVTDRSYLDLAAYYAIRESELGKVSASYVESCILMARSFDLHIHLPFGRLAFEEDGYRPSNVGFNIDIDCYIKSKLAELSLRHLTIKTPDRSFSVSMVLNELRSFNPSFFVR